MQNKLLLILAFAVLLSGCAVPGPDKEYLDKIHTYKPVSILVVPVNNATIDVMAPTSVLATLPTTLAEKGYYVFPVNTVKTILEAEGYYEPAEIHLAPTENLAELFGADTVLYVKIHEWEAKYILLSTTTEVDFEYTLKDRTGVTLWQARQNLAYTPQSDSTGNPFADLIVMAVTAAIERAAPNYLPLTRQANGQAFHNVQRGLPPGPYSPLHEVYYKELSEIEE